MCCGTKAFTRPCESAVSADIRSPVSSIRSACFGWIARGNATAGVEQNLKDESKTVRAICGRQQKVVNRKYESIMYAHANIFPRNSEFCIYRKVTRCNKLTSGRGGYALVFRAPAEAMHSTTSWAGCISETIVSSPRSFDVSVFPSNHDRYRTPFHLPQVSRRGWTT